MPARLRRSLIFWSGFIGASLAWAWWQSWHKVANLWVGDWRYSCANGGALIGWSSGHSPGIHTACSDQAYPKMTYTARDVLWPQGYRGRNMEPGAFLATKSGVDSVFALSTLLELYVVNQAADAWVVYMPFPFLLILTVLLWLAALAWRARRIRKHRRSQPIEA